MLEKLDGVMLAVRDAEVAANTFEKLFATEVLGTEKSDALNAGLTELACGVDIIRLAVPMGPGPIHDHIDRWGEGIVGSVFAAHDPAGVAERVKSKGVEVMVDDVLTLLDPEKTHGLLTMVVPAVEHDPVGVMSFIYEVTHLVGDWQAVSAFWTDIFGLDGMKFSPIKSDQYGYEGTLTLFDPPDKLDRIEVVYPHDTEKAMGRFFVKRGESPYMFFIETDDMPTLREMLDAAGARYAPKEAPAQPNSLFVHPSATHGVLIGVSPKNLAWVWSGRPELAKARD
jgi:catechol 2,3-dioxygenase-like lactoylglutathione lyase family enzyme